MRRRYAYVLSALSLLVACGPNYRYAYEGEAAFERCYALDYESAVTPGDRQACWSTWLQTYSYGANPDRLDYARGRLTASSVGAPPGPPSSGGSLPAMTPSALAAPSPGPAPSVLANSPAPPTAPGVPATTPAPAATLPLTPPPPTVPAEAAGGEPPGTSCSNECRSSWRACGGRCAQRDAACEARCDDGYRDCMRGCY